MSYNFLLTTVGGITSPEIINSIKKFSKNVKIFGIDQNDNAIGKFFVDKFIQSPDSISKPKNYINFINITVKKYKINCIIPMGNNDNIILNKNKKKIKSKILNSLEFSNKNFFNKKIIYEFLKNDKIDCCPEYFIIKSFKDIYSAKKKLNSNSENLILKPTLGTGGRGVFEIYNKINSKKLFTQRTENNLLSYNELSNILKKIKKK